MKGFDVAVNALGGLEFKITKACVSGVDETVVEILVDDSRETTAKKLRTVASIIDGENTLFFKGR